MIRNQPDVTPLTPPTSNRLIELLPPVERARVTARLELVRPKFKAALFEEGEPIRHVYFPITGVGSLLTVMRDGMAVEVATIGAEGMVGLPLLFGAASSPNLCIQQVVGTMWRMRAEELAEELARRGPFHEILHRYAQYFFVQVSQGTACNRLHPAEERLARWLLHTRERVGTNEFELTHEFIAQMLGLRRATVTVLAGALQTAGIIEYHRGIVRVVDAPRLQQASCECYGRIRDEYERILAPHPPRGL